MPFQSLRAPPPRMVSIPSWSSTALSWMSSIRGKRNRRLRFPAESNVIVEVEVIVPRFHVLARLADVTDAFGKKLECFHVAIRAALIVISAPLLDFPWRMFVRRVFLNPRQHLAVAFAGGEFGFQGLGGNSGETEPMMIHWIIVFVFAGCPGDLGAALIKDAGETDIATEAHARTTRRTLP